MDISKFIEELNRRVIGTKSYSQDILLHCENHLVDIFDYSLDGFKIMNYRVSDDIIIIYIETDLLYWKDIIDTVITFLEYNTYELSYISFGLVSYHNDVAIYSNRSFGQEEIIDEYFFINESIIKIELNFKNL